MANRKPKLYIELEADSQRGVGPLSLAFKTVSEAFGAEIVDRPVDAQDVEADVAITDSPRVALRLRNETEKTTIVVVCLPRGLTEAEALAARFPDRMRAASILQYVDTLVGVLAIKTKE